MSRLLVSRNLIKSYKFSAKIRTFIFQIIRLDSCKKKYGIYWKIQIPKIAILPYFCALSFERLKETISSESPCKEDNAWFTACTKYKPEYKGTKYKPEYKGTKYKPEYKGTKYKPE